MTGFLHRAIWQALPRQARRDAVARLASAIATKPGPDARGCEPIIVAGPLRTASGLGQSARLCYRALKAEGIDVAAVDLTGGLMQRLDYPDFGFRDGSRHRGPGTLIVHVNAPFMALAMMLLGRGQAREKRVVGYWAWELPSLPDDWLNGLAFVNEIWVPSRFTAAAVLNAAEGRPVHVLPHPIAIGGPGRDEAGSDERNERNEGPFTVLTFFNAASSVTRKNPEASIAAFRRAFGSDRGVRLIVKASNLDAYPGARERILATGGDSRMELHEAIVGEGALSSLYREADVLLSLHRSEGFGLTLAEAMLHGLPVVATDWSGNADFVTCRTGIPIPFRLVSAQDPQMTYHHPDMVWADPDVDVAALALCKLRSTPDLGRDLGRNGAQFAKDHWGSASYATQVREYLGKSLMA